MEIEKDQLFNFPRRNSFKVIYVDKETVTLKEKYTDKESTYSRTSFEQLIKHRIAKPI